MDERLAKTVLKNIEKQFPDRNVLRVDLDDLVVTVFGSKGPSEGVKEAIEKQLARNQLTTIVDIQEVRWVRCTKSLEDESMFRAVGQRPGRQADTVGWDDRGVLLVCSFDQPHRHEWPDYYIPLNPYPFMQ
ncbi:MAG TPA: hypothetical protein V6D17_20715 [Candidatus Obscuribacterales bacterium]